MICAGDLPYFFPSVLKTDSCVGGSLLLQIRDGCLQILVKPGLVADHSDPDIIPGALCQTRLHVCPEQVHQSLDFAVRPAPVLCRKSINSQIPDPHVIRILQDLLDNSGALRVTRGPGKAAPLGPSSVSVHDDRNMNRYLAFVIQY